MLFLEYIFQQLSNLFLGRNFIQNMPKMRYFFWKKKNEC